MNTPNIPSKSPAVDGDLGAALSFILQKHMQKVDGQLPARVVSYNRLTNRATVQPLISIIGTNAQQVGRAPIAAVPVLALGGGNFFINFPLGPGDLGWIEASDRDISLFLQSAQQSPPNDTRMHSFEHGRFVPDAFDKYTFTPDAGALVISSYDGSTRLVMSAGKIKLLAATIELDGQSLIANMTGTGTTITGAVNLPANTTINGRPFMTHQHTDPQGGDTGGVV